ncbi:MAG: membrane dipeptidase [Pseudomonadota bacterium]
MDAAAQLAPAGPPDAVFDGHNDTVLRLELAARAGAPRPFALEDVTEGAGSNRFRDRRLDIDLVRAARGGFAGGLFAMFTPSGIGPTGLSDDDPDNIVRDGSVDQPTALAFTTALFARMRQLARAHPDRFAVVSTVAEARAAMAAGQVAAIPHIEGAECIDTDLAALEVLHAAGLRSLGPVWSRSNAFGHGAPMAAQPDLEPGEGLTAAGKALVATCEAMGILIDCSHLTEKGFWDVAAATDQPLVASHSNVHAIAPSARNLTDRQLDAVAERGGLVGLNFHVSFLRPDCRHDRDTPMEVLLRHLDHLIERVGEDGVALGSDFDGCLLPQEIGDVSGLPALMSAMRRAGYGEPLVAKIARENWLRLLERVIG